MNLSTTNNSRNVEGQKILSREFFARLVILGLEVSHPVERIHCHSIMRVLCEPSRLYQESNSTMLRRGLPLCT